MINKLISDAQDYYKQNKLEQANHLFQQVLQINEKNIIALNGVGLIAMQAGIMSLAVEFLSYACDLAPKNMIVNKNLALVYTRMARYEEAILQYISMLDINENDSEVHGELARINLQIGNLDLALKHYRYAFEQDLTDPRNIHGLIQLDAESIEENDINEIEKLLNGSTLSLEKRCSFYFALGSIYDKKAHYDDAFANYSVANICKGEKFDAYEHANYITKVIETFSTELFDGLFTENLNQSEQPVFIFGMPRSGTTLVEQILASHTEVYAGGELTLIEDIADSMALSKKKMNGLSLKTEDLTVESLNEYAQTYLTTINNLSDKSGRKKPAVISNKLPENFLYLGLISLLFPNAKIIHCQRNPLDVSLSCYFQNFTGSHPYAYDLKSITLYYQQYERLMTHWKNVLPNKIHTVSYEEMVDDVENVSKRLINYIDLDWQAQCLEFHKNKRHVNTASLVQVRKEIYTSSLNRWQHYDKHIQILKKHFDVSNTKSEHFELSRLNATKNKNEGKALNLLQ
ncbi:hypothetical protein MNBD_GAMMA05-1543 [hydrothermal vent metagenome]|uniref:Uncharacterized protein n=1 Tax=hydrothermal vent metagenome TaxID=652676 RepID=A0A3B0WDV6_9ZZZZ